MDQSTNNNSSQNSVGQVEPHVVLAVLAYFGPLVIVSYLMMNNNSFVKFHVKQGLVILSIEVILWILGMFIWQTFMLWQLSQLINLCLFVLSIIGIINAVQKKEKMLPLIGGFSSYFKF